MKTVIFDLGGVLIDWDPRHLYRKMLDGDAAAMERFLGEICTMEWHIQHDAGRPFAETAAELKRKHPGHDDLIDAFRLRHEEMYRGTIPGSVALLERLSSSGVPLFAITNFPAETFPIAQRVYPFLALFRDIAVSGRERVIKPDARLFNILFRRNNIVPGEAIFIDDSIKNVEAGRALGLHAIHFKSAAVLERDLIAHGLLLPS